MKHMINSVSKYDTRLLKMSVSKALIDYAVTSSLQERLQT